MNREQMNREHSSPGSQFCSFIRLPEKPQVPFPAHSLDPVQVLPLSASWLLSLRLPAHLKRGWTRAGRSQASMPRTHFRLCTHGIPSVVQHVSIPHVSRQSDYLSSPLPEDMAASALSPSSGTRKTRLTL